MAQSTEERKKKNAECAKRYYLAHRGEPEYKRKNQEATKRYRQTEKAKLYKREYDKQYRQDHIEQYGNRRSKRRQPIMEAKGMPCFDCGGRFPPWVMDLHHRDRTEKRFSFNGAESRSAALITIELAKCDVLCANCHRERTYVELTEAA